jgi:hypothetical protein
VIEIGDGRLVWGAASADRASHIWMGSISAGYLPAEFDWPNVKGVVREIKEGIEQLLETRAFEICSRATPWLKRGIDFRRRFPQERFDDVGDFDVLAYWPEQNRWLCVECKYNQPPFCLKDARRLRERIFGADSNRGQFAHIEERRRFFTYERDRLRLLLEWPEPQTPGSPEIADVYVSRSVYWWMRNPPYEVATEFVQIDGLDAWLRRKAYLIH